MVHCGDTAMEMLLSHPRISCPGPMMDILLIPGNPNFDYLLTVRCAGFLHFKTGPFVIASLLWNSTWIIRKFLFLTIFSATHLNIHWWFLPKTVTTIICQVVIFYFCDSFHIYQLEFYHKEDLSVLPHFSIYLITFCIKSMCGYLCSSKSSTPLLSLFILLFKLFQVCPLGVPSGCPLWRVWIFAFYLGACSWYLLD